MLHAPNSRYCIALYCRPLLHRDSKEQYNADCLARLSLGEDCVVALREGTSKIMCLRVLLKEAKEGLL